MQKGQLALQETILTIFIVTVLLIIGLFLFSNYQIQQLRLEQETFAQERFHLSVRTFPVLPEVACSSAGKPEPCLDTSKLRVFSSVVDKNRPIYTTLLGYENISVVQVYPVCASCTAWQLYLNKPLVVSGQLLAKEKVVTPIGLYTPETHSYALGLLTLERYTAQ